MSIQTGAQSAPVHTQKTSVNPRQAQVDARALHDRLHRALATLHEAEHNAVTLFAEILQRRLFRDLGFASIQIYASEALGFSRTKTYEFIRLAEALEKLPELEAGLKAGKVPWTKAREVVKVATPKSEKRWLEIAERSSRRELERQVGRSRALREKRKRDSGQGELIVNQQAAEEKPAQGESGIQKLTSGQGDPAATKPAPHNLQTEFSAAPDPPEAAPVQTVTLRLEPLQRARFDVMVEKLMKLRRRSRDEIVLMALESLLDAGESSNQTKSNQDEESAGEKKSPRVDSTTPYQVVVYRCETCASTTVGPERKPLSAAERGQVECDSQVLEPGKRNRSSIPPARRRRVMLRDGHRCRVQGCDSTHFLEVHHLKSRSQGGSNSEDNLMVMCSSCHAHLHERGGAMPPLRNP